jgi:hypothetical protein
MKIWCVEWKRTDDSPFCHFPCSLHKFHGHFMKLCLINFVFENCVHTECHKMKWQDSALTFLTRYSEQGDHFLSHTATGVETRVSHVTLESKHQSMEWRHTSLPIKKKFKQTISTRKIMCTYSGTENAFYLWNSCLSAQQSTQTLLRSTYEIASCDPQEAKWHS